MIACREVNNTNIVEFLVEGEVSKAEFDKTLETLNAAIEKHGKIRVLEKIQALKGFPISRIWDDVKFGYSMTASNTPSASMTASFSKRPSSTQTMKKSPNRWKRLLPAS